MAPWTLLSSTRRHTRSIRDPGRWRRAVLGVGALVGGLAATAAMRRLWPGSSLREEVALVTGGSRGLGYLLARRLLREGCRVAICGRDAPTLERALDRLRSETAGEVDGWPCDVGDAGQVELLVGRVLARFGRLDIVVNNAGIIRVGPLETMTLDDYHETMDADYWGAVHTTLTVLPHMRGRGSGRIVNITSIAADVPVPHLAPYNAAKHAKLGLSESLRMELAGAGIAVTTVVPGPMRTGSPVHAEFRGQPEKEYAWFALGSILPVTTISAERAAARIVRGIRRGEARITLSWQAKVLRAIHDLAPGATAVGMGLANRAFPGPNGSGWAGPADSAHGLALRGTLPAPIEWALDRAGDRTNQ